MRKIGIVVWVLLVIAFVGLSGGVQAQSDDGLVAEWHFDEGSGCVLKDSSGNGDDGVIYGATWVDGKFGKALSFDGVDDYISLGVNNMGGVLGKGSSVFTISGWIYPSTLGSSSSNHGTRNVILARASNRNNDNFELGISNSGNLDLYIDENNDDITKTFGSSEITTKSWHFFSVAFNSGSVDIYLDENHYISSFAGASLDSASGSPLTIGATMHSKIFFNGVIDEICIYNRALTAEEIKSLYQKSSLSLVKTASPQSIKQGQTATITLTIRNTGTTAIFDIEVADNFDSDHFVEGEASKTYTSLKPKDSREFQYVLQFDEAGTHNLDPATAMYANENGDYHTIESKPISIDIKSSIIPTSTYQSSRISSSNAQSASVHLHGEKTEVVMGEDILLKLAAVNLITKPTMHVQVIITPPSGMSVTSSEFVQSGAGLFTASYEIEPGVGRDIEVKMRSNQVGDFVVNGRIVYYFGDDMDSAEDHT
ncbi:MAG: LamG-like jellyroll fold domain-containing protein, partial [Euryarchaeota archaeon]|nr:LamG-like jellyroll fold domain-containing protein [Euryarchaeota archaeon]